MERLSWGLCGFAGQTVWVAAFLPGVRNIGEMVRLKVAPIEAAAKGGSLAR
jgi:hypothetical protein